MGGLALNSNITGSYNVALGVGAGLSALGSGNVFIGNSAGANETGSDKLYIDSTDTATPLIKGDFAADRLDINGELHVDEIYHLSTGTKMISLDSGGSVHLGPTSMIFTDSSVTGNADIMHSTVGKIQLGLNATDTTTVVGTLNVPDPVNFSNAANKGYVDGLRRDMRNYDDRSVALSSALTALPTQGGLSSKACGIGSGIRGGYAAMALGCAVELSSVDLPAILPRFVRNASVNAGTSFLAHDDPDYTFKVGMTFNFDGQKRNLQASKRDGDLRQRVALLEHTNKALANKTTLAVNHLDRGNRNLANQTASAVNKLGRENRLLQARMKVLQSDREELLAIRADNEAMRADNEAIGADYEAMRADNELLKAQIAQINELLMGEHQLVASQ